MVIGSAAIGVRASTWSSVFIVGPGGPGGFRLPADASPKTRRQATDPISAAVRSIPLSLIADPPCVLWPGHTDPERIGSRYPYTPVASRDQPRHGVFERSRARAQPGPKRTGTAGEVSRRTRPPTALATGAPQNARPDDSGPMMPGSS